MASVWKDLLDATAAVIRGLALQGLPDDRVYVRKFPTDRGVSLPCVLVCLGGAEDLDPVGDLEGTEVGYPVLVAHVFASDQDLTLDDTELQWRQGILDAFLDLPRLEVTSAEVTDCRIDTHPAIDLTLFRESNLDAGGFLLKFDTRRQRPGR